MPSRLTTLVGLVFVMAAATLLPAYASAADTIYWGNAGNNKISFARTDGGGGGDIRTEGASIEEPLGLALDPSAGRVYWANFGALNLQEPVGISSASLDGKGGKDLKIGAASAVVPSGLAIDPTTKTIYWANFSRILEPPVLSFAKLEPTNAAEGEGGDLGLGGVTIKHPNAVAVDPIRKLLYWTNGGQNGQEGAISVAHLDTGKAEDIKIDGANHEGPRGLAVDPAAGLVYWTNSIGNEISFARLDGGGGGDLPIPAADIDQPSGIAIDHAAGRIYWANSGEEAAGRPGSIFTAKLDGSDAHEVKVAGASLSSPGTPNLLVAPRSTAAPAVVGGTTNGTQLSCAEGAWAADVPVSFLYDAAEKFAFQWTLDGKDIPGANARTVTAKAGGLYACRVTATNRAGSTGSTSAPHQVSGAKPTLTKVVLKPRRFSKSTVLRFLSSEAGVLTVKIAKGKKVTATITRKVKAGKGKIRFGKRIGKRRLAPGRYVLTATLRDAAGGVSKPVRRSFTVLAQ